MNPLQRLFDRLLGFARDLVTALLRGIVGAPVTALKRALPELTIRTAAPSEVIDLRHKMLRPGLARSAAIWTADSDSQTVHWIAQHEQRTIAVASVMSSPCPQDPLITRQLRGMAVAPRWQQRGVGTALLAEVMAQVDEPMWCNARIAVVPFYQRAGWRVISERFEIEGVGPHQRMRWQP